MDNRDRLLRCALRLFAARGYDAVGVQAIAEAAGVTKPTLYHYFRSKRGLLAALLDEHFEELLSAVRPAADYQGDLTMTLRRVVLAYFDFARHHRTFYRLQISLWFAPPGSEAHQAVAPAHEEQYRLIEALFTRAARDHGNMRGRQRPYAATFLGMINNYVALALNGYTELDETLVVQAVHQFMHGILS